MNNLLLHVLISQPLFYKVTLQEEWTGRWASNGTDSHDLLPLISLPNWTLPQQPGAVELSDASSIISCVFMASRFL